MWKNVGAVPVTLLQIDWAINQARGADVSAVSVLHQWWQAFTNSMGWSDGVTAATADARKAFEGSGA
jgi:hypothetical protein